MTTKKQKPEMMNVHKNKKAFFPCELTVGSTIQLDGWTAETNKDRNGEIIITDSDPIYPDLVTVTIRFTHSQEDKRKPLVCKVRNIVAACSGFGNYFDINYLVETDLEYNEREKGVFTTDQFHSFNIVHVTQILERANAPVNYKWVTYAYRHDPIHKMLFDMCPGVDYFMPKILDNLKEKGLICHPDKNRPYDYVVRNKKKLKAYLKRNINRFKAFKYPVISEYADDSHGLTTDDGYDGYIDYV